MAAQLYDEETIQAFHREAACLADQYSNYSIADSLVDGNLTLGENLADHGGLRMALAAYTQWRQDHVDYRWSKIYKQSPTIPTIDLARLPALPFDDMQLFFIGYALPWCSRHTQKHSRSQVCQISL